MGPRQGPWATWRLAAGMALAVTALSLIGMGLQYRLVEARMMAASRALLTADLDGLAALYEQRRIIALRQAIDYRAAIGGGGDMLLLLNREGRVLAGSETAWPPDVAPAGEGFAAEPGVIFADKGQRWLAVARTLPGGFPLLVARSLAPVDATLAALRRGMLGLTVVLLGAGAAVGWFAARSVMRRIGRVNALADRVAAGDLGARLPGPRQMDEFGLLETHVHGMLDRIETLNRATHRLSDSIAHELRTPLNRIAQKLGQIAGQEDVVDDLHAEMRQTVRVFDSLLDISRAEADTGGGGLLPVDLSSVLVGVWDLYEPLAEEKGLICTAEMMPGAVVLGDRTLIGQMVANLLDNAIKYCAAGDSLTLRLTDGPGRFVLVVADTGPGLPPDLRDTAFDAFVRADRDRGIKGHGLGLALVRAIATRHGARLTVLQVEKGFALEIGWPKVQSGD